MRGSACFDHIIGHVVGIRSTLTILIEKNSQLIELQNGNAKMHHANHFVVILMTFYNQVAEMFTLRCVYSLELFLAIFGSF